MRSQTLTEKTTEIDMERLELLTEGNVPCSNITTGYIIKAATIKQAPHTVTLMQMKIIIKTCHNICAKTTRFALTKGRTCALLPHFFVFQTFDFRYWVR